MVLSGFPRHDALLEVAESTTPHCLLIVPTWRRYLTDETDRTGLKHRKPVSIFLESKWAKQWGALLRSEELRRVAEVAGLEVAWAPHPNMAIYTDIFDTPSWVRSIDVREGSYQELFASASVAVTDFSSAVFDVAYLNRPIVYFHFDRESIGNSGHVWRPGYFDYKTHGFGPVCESVDDVVERIDNALQGREEPVFQDRRLRTFAFRDGNSSERIVNEIHQIQAKLLT